MTYEKVSILFFFFFFRRYRRELYQHSQLHCTCTGEPFKSNVKRLFDMFVFICTLLALPIKFLVRWEKITVKMTGWSKRTDKQLIKIKYRRQLYKSWI